MNATAGAPAVEPRPTVTIVLDDSKSFENENKEIHIKDGEILPSDTDPKCRVVNLSEYAKEPQAKGWTPLLQAVRIALDDQGIVLFITDGEPDWRRSESTDKDKELGEALRENLGSFPPKPRFRDKDLDNIWQKPPSLRSPEDEDEKRLSRSIEDMAIIEQRLSDRAKNPKCEKSRVRMLLSWPRSANKESAMEVAAKGKPWLLQAPKAKSLKELCRVIAERDDSCKSDGPSPLASDHCSADCCEPKSACLKVFPGDCGYAWDESVCEQNSWKCKEGEKALSREEADRRVREILALHPGFTNGIDYGISATCGLLPTIVAVGEDGRSPRNPRMKCTGVFIDGTHVLTARHCLPMGAASLECERGHGRARRGGGLAEFRGLGGGKLSL